MRTPKYLFLKRKIKNIIGLSLACFAMAFGLFFLGAILWTLIKNGLPAMGTAIFSEMTPPPGQKGGLLNAIYGSFILVGCATLVGTPIGILGGTYLSEYGAYSRWTSVIRFVNSILMSAPSVVIGFFVYTIVVVPSHHFSGWAGVMALTVIIIPVVVSTTENMLRLIPQSLREAAAALGAPQWHITFSVTFQAAKAGLLTGVLLGVARISGETAPLLFTALNNQFWNSNLSTPIANLPVVIFQFAMSPYEDWQHLAWAGALLITLAVLFLNILARFSFRQKI